MLIKYKMTDRRAELMGKRDVLYFYHSKILLRNSFVVKKNLYFKYVQRLENRKIAINVDQTNVKSVRVLFTLPPAFDNFWS